MHVENKVLSMKTLMIQENQCSYNKIISQKLGSRYYLPTRNKKRHSKLDTSISGN